MVLVLSPQGRTSLTALGQEGRWWGALLQMAGALAVDRVMCHHSVRKVKSFNIRGGETMFGLLHKAGKNIESAAIKTLPRLEKEKAQEVEGGVKTVQMVISGLIS